MQNWFECKIKYEKTKGDGRKGILSDYVIEKLEETPIIDIYKYTAEAE